MHTLDCHHLTWNCWFVLSFSVTFFVSDSTGIDDIETVIPCSQYASDVFVTETQKQFSRYYNEFEELQLLGKGAFGAVIKVHTVRCVRQILFHGVCNWLIRGWGVSWKELLLWFWLKHLSCNFHWAGAEQTGWLLLRGKANSHQSHKQAVSKN